MSAAAHYDLSLTTQGPTYPPSEVMDPDGNFIVIGRINSVDEQGQLRSAWGRAIVSAASALPPFGQNLPYEVVRWLPEQLGAEDQGITLHTLPLPLPCNNYPMVFAPAQRADAATEVKPSHAFHEVPIPDLLPEHGRRLKAPVTLGQWCQAKGQLRVSLTPDGHDAAFEFDFQGLLPDSLYTVMTLRQRDLDPAGPTRPGPLGVPNVFVTDGSGGARYRATLPDPFPDPARPGANRVINVVVLWMSYQMNRGGAIGWYGLGGDIHAQLKLKAASFEQFTTHPHP